MRSETVLRLCSTQRPNATNCQRTGKQYTTYSNRFKSSTAVLTPYLQPQHQPTAREQLRVPMQTQRVGAPAAPQRHPSDTARVQGATGLNRQSLLDTKER